MITIKEFRLPQAGAREKMTVEELFDARDQFYRWYLMHEESMTFDDADRMMDKLSRFEDYIETRIPKKERKLSAIDQDFCDHAETFFGKRAMEAITDEQIEEARVFTCRMISDTVTAGMTVPEYVDQWEMFNNYLFEHFF